MATFGPALFQYFANTVQFDKDGFVKPFTQEDYTADGFGPQSEKMMETFKSAVFKMIMLRARNEAIHNIECGIGDKAHVFVDLHMRLSDEHFHSDAASSMPYETPNEFSEKTQAEIDRQPVESPTGKNTVEDRCAPNTRLVVHDIIHNAFSSFSHDVVSDSTGQEIGNSDLNSYRKDCAKPLTCGASDAFLDQSLVGDLARYRTTK